MDATVQLLLVLAIPTFSQGAINTIDAFPDYYKGPFTDYLAQDSQIYRDQFLGWQNEISVDQVKEGTFNIEAHSVRQWQRLESDHLYLLGTTETGVILVTLYKIAGFKYQVHEYPVETPYRVKTSLMFNAERQVDKTNESMVLLGLESPESTISVYKIFHFKLHHITDWKRGGQLRALSHFKWYSEERIVIFEDVKNNSIGSVYGFQVEEPVPHIWLTEILPLTALTGQPSIGVDREGSLWMAIIQEPLQQIALYSYRRMCKEFAGSRFELYLEIPTLLAKQTAFFHSHGAFYFLVSGNESVLFRFMADGILTKDVTFGKSKDLMVIPLTNPEDHAIILGKYSDGTPRFYTTGIGGFWREEPTSCETLKDKITSLAECLGGPRSWDGATYIEEEGNPSIIFANRKSNEIYHILLSVRKVPAVLPPATHNLLEALETYFDNLRGSLTNLIAGRSSEASVNNHSSSSCEIAGRINEIQKFLSEVKILHSNDDCSVNSTDDLKSNEHSIVIDEARPAEIIHYPGDDVYHDSANQDDFTSNHIEAMETHSLNDDGNHKKFPMISPDIKNDIHEKYIHKVEGFEDNVYQHY